MSLVVAFMAQSHQIAPYEPQGGILSDWYYMVYFAARSRSVGLVAVLTQWVQPTVSCRQLVPSMIIVPLAAPVALVAVPACIVVSSWAYLLHVFSLAQNAPPYGTSHMGVSSGA